MRQQDAAGLSVVTRAGGVRRAARAPRRGTSHLLDALDALQPAGGTDLFGAADHLAERVPRRSLVSSSRDLFDDREDALKRHPRRCGPAQQRRGRCSTCVDPAELTFPFDDPTLFLSHGGRAAASR